MNPLRTLAVAFFFLAAGLAPACAVEPGEMLEDPALEQRAQEISQHLRCVVCQNQTIDDSNAPLAHDMRLLVRERLVAGDSDEEVVDYVVARYGNFVLLRPPFQPETWLLWAAPFLVLLLAIGGLFMQMRPRAQSAIRALSKDEQRRLSERLGAGGEA